MENNKANGIQSLIDSRDEQAKEYDLWYEKTHKNSKEEELSIIKALNPSQNEEVLDVGCGTGHFSQHIAPLCKSLVGIDYSPESIKIFNEKRIPNMKGYVWNVANPLEEKRKFDKAVSSQVIQHIPTEELRLQALKNILDILKDGGIFVCELQDWTALSRRFKRIKSRIGGGEFRKKKPEGFTYTDLPRKNLRLCSKKRDSRIT